MGGGLLAYAPQGKWTTEAQPCQACRGQVVRAGTGQSRHLSLPQFQTTRPTAPLSPGLLIPTRIFGSLIVRAAEARVSSPHDARQASPPCRGGSNLVHPLGWLWGYRHWELSAWYVRNSLFWRYVFFQRTVCRVHCLSGWLVRCAGGYGDHGSNLRPVS